MKDKLIASVSENGNNIEGEARRVTHLERHLRNLGIRNRELAEAVNVSEKTVSNWLSGRFEADRAKLPDIADFLRERGAPAGMEAASLFLEWKGENGE